MEIGEYRNNEIWKQGIGKYGNMELGKYGNMEVWKQVNIETSWG